MGSLPKPAHKICGWVSFWAALIALVLRHLLVISKNLRMDVNFGTGIGNGENKFLDFSIMIINLAANLYYLRILSSLQQWLACWAKRLSPQSIHNFITATKHAFKATGPWIFLVAWSPANLEGMSQFDFLEHVLDCQPAVVVRARFFLGPKTCLLNFALYPKCSAEIKIHIMSLYSLVHIYFFKLLSKHLKRNFFNVVCFFNKHLKIISSHKFDMFQIPCKVLDLIRLRRRNGHDRVHGCGTSILEKKTSSNFPVLEFSNKTDPVLKVHSVTPTWMCLISTLSCGYQTKSIWYPANVQFIWTIYMPPTCANHCYKAFKRSHFLVLSLLEITISCEYFPPIFVATQSNEKQSFSVTVSFGDH